MDVTFWKEVLAILGSLVAFTASLWAFVRTTPTYKGLQAAIKEFRPNGGSSMYDRLARLDANIELVNSRVASIENSLSRTEAINSIILDQSPSAYYICDSAGNCTYSNDALCDLFGMHRSEMSGLGWIAGVHEDDQEGCFKRWMDSVNNRYPYSHHYRLKSGTHCHTSTQMYQTADNDVMFVGVVKPEV